MAGAGRRSRSCAKPSSTPAHFHDAGAGRMFRCRCEKSRFRSKGSVGPGGGARWRSWQRRHLGSGSDSESRSSLHTRFENATPLLVKPESLTTDAATRGFRPSAAIMPPGAMRLHWPNRRIENGKRAMGAATRPLPGSSAHWLIVPDMAMTRGARRQSSCHRCHRPVVSSNRTLASGRNLPQSRPS
jgi:hypothetical protein